MYENNTFAGNPYYFGNGFAQGQQYVPPRKPRFTNPLTEEDKKSLKTQGSFNLLVTDKDLKKAYCTHKDADQISLRENPDGTVTCWVCGETFNLGELTLDGVVETTQAFLDLLQTIKTYYLDIPEGVVKEFFQMMPFIAKTPEIYKLAVNNFQSYENPMVAGMNPNASLFSMYDAATAPGYFGGYQPQMAQPYPYQQPVPAYGVPQGYAAPAPMVPQMPPNAAPVGGFGYVDNGMPVGSMPVQQMPQQPQMAPVNQPVSPIPQPGASTPSDSVQATKTFNL